MDSIENINIVNHLEIEFWHKLFLYAETNGNLSEASSLRKPETMGKDEMWLINVIFSQ